MILTSKHTDFSRLYRGNHRYGFQGMESDNEVKGDKNSYTTEFRMLDPRIGRWLSLDPEMKKYASKTPYMTFSNNPIIMIDPKGDDDYFHADGTFSHSTPIGNKILVQSASGKYKQLSDMPLKTIIDRIVVIMVINNYAQKVGVSGTVGLATMKTEDGARPYASTGSKSNNVNINILGGSISSELSDMYNLTSVLEHEKNHQDDNKKGENSNEDSFEGALNHAKIYENQIKNDTYENTTEDFKKGQVGAYVKHLEKAASKVNETFDVKGNTQKLDGMIKDFNNGAGKKLGFYINVSGSGELIKIEAKKYRKPKK